MSGSTRSLSPVGDPSWLSLPAGVLAAGAVLRYAPLSTDAAAMLAITVFCVALWVGTPVDPWFTSLVGLGLIGVAFSTDLALVGFRSPATWLVVVGILIGEATRASGLASLVERVALARIPDRVAGNATGAYRYLLATFSAAALAMAVLVPSSLVRVLVLGPILISVGDRFTERRPRVGLFLGPLFVTFYGASGVLTGSLSNIIVNGLLESSAGVSVTWTQWALYLGPVMGLGRAVLIVVIAYFLYRPRTNDGIDLRRADGDVTVSPSERRMLAFLLVGVAVWTIDFVDGLHPLFGAIVVALLSFAPRIGVVGQSAVDEADFSIVFFLGAIFAIAEGLRETGFTDLTAGRFLSLLPATRRYRSCSVSSSSCSR